MRLDVWLDVTCLLKTRSEAKKACEGGKVDVNGQASKPHREIKPGDEIQITRPFGRRQKVIVRGLQAKHIPRPEPNLPYAPLTPEPHARGSRAAADGASGGAVPSSREGGDPGQARAPGAPQDEGPNLSRMC